MMNVRVLSIKKNFIDFTEFEKTTPVIGVWDDHDFGCNNGDK